jgi:hypothetical protein
MLLHKPTVSQQHNPPNIESENTSVGPSQEDGGTISFASAASEISAALDQTTDLHKQQWSHAYGKGSIDVPCGPLGKYLEIVGVNR